MPITYLKEFELWDFYSPLDKKLKLINANNFPHITYDDGLPCYDAIGYMRSRLSGENKVKMTTLKTYAKDIHHLVRYCYQNKVLFSQLTDDRFRHFIQTLQSERNHHDQLVRTNNHVIKIGKQCLDFLMYIQTSDELVNFIGEGRENAIRVKNKTHQIRIEGSKNTKIVNEISHAAIPTKNPVKKRDPISREAASKVWEYITTQDNPKKRFRDKTIYQCLESLGARITEVHLLKVDDIKRAMRSGKNPYLEVTTLKRRHDEVESRFIPVTNDFLLSMEEYNLHVRKKIIKETIGKKNDHGYFFVSLTTGKPLQSSTITGYMNEWKKILGITTPVHPHLFRHAFITNKLIELIREHKVANQDEFREAILHTEMFKMKLKEWTGHKFLSSLESYLHLAFAQINGYDKAYSAVSLNDSVKVMKQNLEGIKFQATKKEITPTEMLFLLEKTINTFEESVEKALRQ